MAAKNTRIGPKPQLSLVTDVRHLLAEAPSHGIPIDSLRTSFDDLTVAVVGRTNSGKSTLVNALIGHRIAPTRATECTKVITRFQFGPQETATVVHVDGTKRPLPLTDDGTLPDDPGTPHQDIQRIDVWRSYEPLRNLTVIDTPGLFGDEGLAAHTEQLLAGDAVDVLLFVYSGAITDYEVEVLRKFRRRTRRRYDAPINVIGVLTHADLLGWDVALAAAQRNARELSDCLSGVLPVIGKIAETTETGRFNQDHAQWLRHLAGLPSEDRDIGLFDSDEFAEFACGIPAKGRAELVDRLDMYGIRAIAGSNAAHGSAPRMAETLRAMSGIAGLRDRIETMFVRASNVHVTARILASLRLTAAGLELATADRDWLDDADGAVRSSAPMHVLDELRALALLYSGRCDLSEQDREAAIGLFSHSDPAARLGISARDAQALATAAEEAETHWAAIEKSTIDPQASMVARTAAWSAALISRSWSRT